MIPRPLSNNIVRIEPLEQSHREGLRAAAAGDAGIFQWMQADLSGERFDAWFEDAIRRSDGKTELGFAVREADGGRLVGSTRYLAMVAEHRRLEIGWTWYTRAAWGTSVNPACKHLLLRHAFEDRGANRVELKTDARNARSRAAILKLGATQEGTFRHHMVMPDGHLRDTVWFSILRDEWPAIAARLEQRMALAGNPPIAR